MRHAALILAVTMTALAGSTSAQQAMRPGADLQAAIRTETVDGDLKGAIELYRKLATSSDRAVAAQALVRLGQCHEKLGSAEARQAYERAARDFPDQAPTVATAQARLVALGGTPFGFVYRQMWTGPKVDTLGTVSPDGRYLSCVDWDTGDLALHDFATNSDRRLTNKGPWDQSDEFAEESVISRDGKQIAYAWFNGKDRYELRVASLPASGLVQPRRLLDSEDILWVGPYDWSPDDQRIAVLLQRKDRTVHIGIVSAQTGSLRVLEQGEGTSKALFSPDGRYLAYDARMSGRPVSDRDVFVLAVDGGSETKVAASPGQDVMMSWSPDGRTLLFASDRTGSMALWGVPLADGKAGGAAVLLRPGIQAGSLGITAAGVLFSATSISSRDIHVVSLDFSTGKVLSPPVRPIETYVGSNGQPDWSPDGKQLAYVSTQGRPADQRILAIRSIDSGETRELRPNLRGFTSPRWSPDGLSFLCQGTDQEGRPGIYRIDARTGETVPIAISTEMGAFQWPQWSPDGKRLYYAVRGQLVERDVASGVVRELLPKQNVAGPVISPDGRYIAAHAGFKGAAPSEPSSAAILVIPVAGGESRELVRVRAPEQLRPVLAWTPGGRGVLAEKFSDNGNRRELWLFPVEGGEPRKIDLAIDRNTSPLRIHPDGRRLAYVAGETKYEVVALENFLPGPGPAK